MKRLLTLAVVLTMSGTMLAGPVNQQQAMKVAETVLQTNEITLSPTRSFKNLYVFNGKNSFVIVAADDCARPILAYSKDFCFKTEQMPENIWNWLASLNVEIQDAVDMKLKPTEEILREWELLSQGKMPEPKQRAELKPLIKTHWDQYEPYSNLCPDGSLTGCVATAMAQIMKYWEWPNKGTGSHSYPHNTYGELSVNFGDATYDWDNMVGEVFYDSPEAQQTAVATLMYHCGVSVDMDYSPSGSTAYSDRVGEALYTYFDYYQNDMRWEYASNYNADSWVALLKAELDAGRPLVYSGRGEGGGHAFICDGYDANDYLHFNWGWSGFCDGYYAYGALTPGTGGAGSGSGSYNELNFVIAGIHPNTSSVATPTNFSASASDRTVTLSWSPVPGATRYKVYRDGFVINTNVVNTSYTDSNVTYGSHFYYVRAVNANGVYSLQSEKQSVAVTYPGPVPTNLTANVQSHDVHLSWIAPASESAQLKYGDGEAISSSYGSLDTTGFTWGQRYTPQQLALCAGMAITSVEFFTWKVSDYSMFIYKEVDEKMELLVTESFSNTDAGWYTVNLSTPLPIDYEHNLIVSFYNDCSVYQYVAAFTDGYEGSGNARLYMNDGHWYAIDNDISWLIKTNITDDTYTYSVYRDGLSIAENVAETNYIDADLPNGYYQYSVCTNYYGGQSELSEAVETAVGSVGLISVLAVPSEGGTVAGGGYCGVGNIMTVSALANTNYLFDRWTENGVQISTSNIYSFVVDGDRQLVAEFKDNDLSVADVSIVEPTCNGGANGSVTVFVSGGAAPFVFELEEQTSPASENSYTFQDVGAGSYSLKVTDSTGYGIVTSVIVENPSSLSAGTIKSGSESVVVEGTCSPILSVQDATSGQPGLTYRWKKNGSVISDSNTSQYTPTGLQPGTYNFIREVKDECTEWIRSSGTWRVMVSQNAVDESDANLLEVYPNPTNDKVVVRCERMESVTVFSVTGQQLTTMEVDGDHVDVDMADFQPGVYVLVIRTCDGVNRVRVIRD